MNDVGATRPKPFTAAHAEEKLQITIKVCINCTNCAQIYP